MPLLRSERRKLLKFGPSLTPAATSTPAIPHCTIIGMTEYLISAGTMDRHLSVPQSGGYER
jgi:hypothetical protein